MAAVCASKGTLAAGISWATSIHLVLMVVVKISDVCIQERWQLDLPAADQL
jgi:hypothetical protein